MKRIVLILFIFNSSLMFSQTKEELKSDNQKLQTELKELKQKLEKSEKENQKHLENTKKNIELILKYKEIIKNNNSIYFYNLFEKNYKNDISYTTRVKLLDDDLDSYRKGLTYLNNIVLDENQSDKDREIAKNVITLIENYIEFRNIQEEYKTFFSEKYELQKADNYIDKLNRLSLDKFTGLKEDRTRIIADITNYKDKSCELKRELDIFKKSGLITNKSDFENLKKIMPFDYLQKLLDDCIKNFDNYKEDSLPDCQIKKENDNLIKEPENTETKE